LRGAGSEKKDEKEISEVGWWIEDFIHKKTGLDDFEFNALGIEASSREWMDWLAYIRLKVRQP
jgi:hypothetical protein